MADTKPKENATHVIGGAQTAIAEQKRVPGTPWKPGQSGNPGGKPIAVKQALAEYRKPEDLRKLRERLLEIALGDNLKAAVSAIHEYHDRAYGRAPLAIHAALELAQAPAFDLSQLTTDEVRALQVLTKAKERLLTNGEGGEEK